MFPIAAALAGMSKQDVDDLRSKNWCAIAFRLFLLRLCLAAARKSQRECLESMDSLDLSEWIAYDKLFLLPDPYRARRGDVMRSSPRPLGGKEMPVGDFMPTRPPVVRRGRTGGGRAGEVRSVRQVA